MSTYVPGGQTRVPLKILGCGSITLELSEESKMASKLAAVTGYAHSQYENILSEYKIVLKHGRFHKTSIF